MTRSLLSVSDLNIKELEKIFKKMKSFKSNYSPKHKGRSIGLLFEKHSTRTRLSFEVAISRLGANPIYINKSDTQISRGESISETAKIFSLYLDALIYRTTDQQNMVDFHESSSIPIVNALSDLEHPTQIISDIYTIIECYSRKKLNRIKLVYFGDGNNSSELESVSHNYSHGGYYEVSLTVVDTNTNCFDSYKEIILSLILSTNFFTINQIQKSFVKNAHYTSAKFNESISEFEMCKLDEEYINNFHAPFVKQSNLKIGLELKEIIKITSNDSTLVVGEIKQITTKKEYLKDDFMFDLEKSGALAIGGLNEYFTIENIANFPYVRLNDFPNF